MLPHQTQIAEYMAHEWSLVMIPPGRKGPYQPGWNKRAAAVQDPLNVPEGYGVGLAHAYSGTMAFDIDNIALTTQYGIDVQGLYTAPDAVTVESGKAGHGKLLYKMPFGLALPSKKVQVNKLTAFELRCGTIDGLTVQDVLPPTTHPEVGRPYAWAGKGDWRNLPTIPTHLLTLWYELLKTEPLAVQVDGIDASWDEIREAVEKIDPDCTREDWIHVGMALHWTGTQLFKLEEAFHIWREWSMKGLKYPGDNAFNAQWRSFKSEKQQPVTLGTLFHIARQYGWSRPVPDASELFSATDVITSPAMLNQDLRPAPPEIDMSLWPDILTKRAKEVSDSVGCDPLVPLFAGLGAVCAVIDAQSRLELMPGFQVPPVLWLMTIGDPADKKSPGSRPMLAPLRSIELEDLPRFKKEMDTWTILEAAYATAKKAALDYAGSPDYLVDPASVPAIPEQPKEPVAVMLTVSDITSQKLVRHAADRPRGFLCYLDEMNSWIRKLVDKSSGEDRSCWVQAYEAQHYKMDRVGSGSIHAENLAVSIYGNIQPRVFRESIDLLSNDGLLQRFIPGVLRHEKTRRGEPIPDFMSIAPRWENTLRLIYALPPMLYKLTPAAYRRFRDFQTWYEKLKQAERLVKANDTFMTAIGKLEGLTGRLILLFHVIENPWTTLIDVEMVNRVIDVVTGFVVPSMKYALGEIGEVSTFDRWLTEYVVQYSDQQSMKLAQIKTSAKRHFEGMSAQQSYQIILAGMETLERANWVRRGDDGKREYQGQAEWLINPRLKEMFKDHRRKVIEAQQWVMQARMALQPDELKVYAHGNEGDIPPVPGPDASINTHPPRS